MSKTNRSYAQQLPKELLFLIFSYLDVPIIRTISPICKQWYSLLSEDTFWKYLTTRDFGPISGIKSSWKTIYQQRIMTAIEFGISDSMLSKISRHTQLYDKNVSNIMIIGDQKTGKTGLLITFVTGLFPTGYIPIFGGNWKFKTVVGNNVIEMRLIDTWVGDYLAYYQEANLIMMVFSVIDRSSMRNVAEKWVPKTSGVPIILVGTKTDLRKEVKESIMPEEGIAFARKIGAIGYFECSALQRRGIQAPFHYAAKIISDAHKNKKCIIQYVTVQHWFDRFVSFSTNNDDCCFFYGDNVWGLDLNLWCQISIKYLPFKLIRSQFKTTIKLVSLFTRYKFYLMLIQLVLIMIWSLKGSNYKIKIFIGQKVTLDTSPHRFLFLSNS